MSQFRSTHSLVKRPSIHTLTPTRFFEEDFGELYTVGTVHSESKKAKKSNGKKKRRNEDSDDEEEGPNDQLLEEFVSEANSSRLMRQRCEEIHRNFMYYCTEKVEGQMGIGIVALRDIPKGTPIAYYNGKLSLISTKNARQQQVKDHAITMGHGFMSDHMQLYLDATHTPLRPGRAQMINHKCPNCSNCIMENEQFSDDNSGIGLEVVFTTKLIPMHTFLWYSYGESFFPRPDNSFFMDSCCYNPQYQS
jgi:hypothetical protein